MTRDDWKSQIKPAPWRWMCLVWAAIWLFGWILNVIF